MKKLIGRLLVILLPPAVLVLGFNYFIDPANLFSPDKYVWGIADILTKGHNVDNVLNYDERLLQAEMVKRLRQKPAVIVLGSSRIMEAGSDFFPGKTVLNCAVSHANIYDIAAITGLLDSLQRLPDEIYLNADIGLIGTEATTEWQSLSPYFKRFERFHGEEGDIENIADGMLSRSKLKSAISLEYFRESLDFFLKGKKKEYKDVDTVRPVNYGRFADGTVAYSDKYVHQDVNKIAHDAFLTGKSQGISMPDTIKMGLLNQVLDFYRNKKISVHLILLPYHPLFYAGVEEKQAGAFEKYEDYYHKIAKERNLQLKGAFDAKKIQVTAGSFYDMYHSSKEIVKKIIL